jgi:small ligand-binding sensory domain FIST
MTGEIRIAAALSEHPLATVAAGECLGELYEQLGGEADLCAVFATPPFGGVLDEVIGATRELLGPKTTIGATSGAVSAGSQEVEEAGAIAIWAARLPTTPTSIRLGSSVEDGEESEGWTQLADRSGTLVLLVDPFGFPVERLLDFCSTVAPDLKIVGGLTASSTRVGGELLSLDGRFHRDGAVGVWLDPSVDVEAVVSQGCRPFGEPLVVTKSERNIVYELGGQPALERLMAQLELLTPEDRAVAAQGIHAGIVIDDQRLEYGQGDFLIRNVLGADRSVGAVAVGHNVDVGSIVQFQLRDPARAAEDLALSLGSRRAAGALVFTCTGRGTSMFAVESHDAALVSESLSGAPLAGMSCSGELGPVRGTNFIHTFTASVAVFGGTSDPN